MNKRAKVSTASAAIVNRREFVVAATAVAATAGFVSRASAQDLPLLAADDAMALALKYVEDASTADAALRQDGAACQNCALFSGAADADMAACSIFPGKRVKGSGWCSVWAAKPAA